jgi:hypothetical protein
MIVVSEFLLVGTVPSTGTRIQDMLKEGNTDFIRLSDVQVCHNLDSKSEAATLPEVVIPKAKIEFVILVASQHEAPQKRFNNLSTTSSSDVFALVGKYRLKGRLHLPSMGGDSLDILNNKLGRFFPITEATVNDTGDSAWTVLANRDCVSCFHVGECTTPRTAGPEQPLTTTKGTAPEDETLLALLENVRAVATKPDSAVGLDSDVCRAGH